PDAVAPDGRVTRPEGSAPAVAGLSGTFPDGSERTFRFRVLPRGHRLPLLSVHVGEPLEKEFDRDFSCFFLPAGAEAAQARRLCGTGDRGGGAHNRGNTSYVKGSKRSIALEFDEPFDRGDGAPPARHLLLLSGYADPTRMRNRLCYGLFEAMPRGGGRLAPPVSWAEVALNGAWAGIWETAPRPQDAAGPGFSDLYKVRGSRGLWSEPSASPVERVGAPAAAGTDPYGPFLDLAGFVCNATDADFAARAGDVFDLDELADFWLLLNFSGNVDGRVTNQLVGRRAADGRWVLLPWDYDKTFMAGSPAGKLSNPLFDRLFATRPDFRARVRDRWAELRTGPFSDAAILARIDADAAVLAPLMDEEWRLLRPAGFDGDFPAAVAALRETALARAASLDSMTRGD
ncbi:MAG: CotH kinase family protein, partial [Kiritimatiellae bacterium]|nr:CotH kinase family protein [Kiritimatiellia bacterium]